MNSLLKRQRRGDPKVIGSLEIIRHFKSKQKEGMETTRQQPNQEKGEMKMKKLIVFLVAVWLTGGMALAQEPPNYVTPDATFALEWTPADPPGEAYYVERWTKSTGAWAPMISVIDTRVTDSLVAGETAQYRVFSYTDTTWTDSTGTYTERCVGPTSDASIAVVAGEGPPPSTTPGGCGRPALVQP